MRKLHLLVFLLPFAATGQRLENLTAATEGTHIIITYDITEGVTGDLYDVSLYASHNNFSSEIKKVTGNVGRGQFEGKNKRIDWDAKGELGEFKGQLSFEIRVEVIAVFALQKNVTSTKRGKNLSINWRGGNRNQDVKVELLKGGSVESSLALVPNQGSYQWQIPEKQKPGSDYQLRLVNGGDVVTSDKFAVKRKIPLGAKIGAATLLVLIALPPKSSESNTDARKLPAPPSLTLN